MSDYASNFNRAKIYLSKYLTLKFNNEQYYILDLCKITEGMVIMSDPYFKDSKNRDYVYITNLILEEFKSNYNFKGYNEIINTIENMATILINWKLNYKPRIKNKIINESNIDLLYKSMVNYDNIFNILKSR